MPARLLPLPPGVQRRVVISANGITVQDEDGKRRWQWGELKYIRTPAIALQTYCAMRYVVVEELRNARGVVHTRVLEKRKRTA